MKLATLLLCLTLGACASVQTRFERLPDHERRAFEACLRQHRPCGLPPQWLGETIHAMTKYERWSELYYRCCDALKEEYLEQEGAARSRWLSGECSKGRALFLIPPG